MYFRRKKTKDVVGVCNVQVFFGNVFMFFEKSNRDEAKKTKKKIRADKINEVIKYFHFHHHFNDAVSVAGELDENPNIYTEVYVEGRRNGKKSKKPFQK